MSSIPSSSSPVELCFTFQLGPVIRDRSTSRPISLDAIARDFGQQELDRMLEAPGQWIGIEPGRVAVVAWVSDRQGDPLLTGSGHPSLPAIQSGTPENAKVRV